MVAIAKAIEPIEKAAAKEREREGGRSKGSGKLPEASKGDTRDKVAKPLGMSGRTFEKAKEVVAAGKKNPKKYAAIVEQMD